MSSLTNRGIWVAVDTSRRSPKSSFAIDQPASAALVGNRFSASSSFSTCWCPGMASSRVRNAVTVLSSGSGISFSSLRVPLSARLIAGKILRSAILRSRISS
ncbi:MAG: hypothetical protein ACK56F_12495, partial [bacterium]